MQIGLMAKPEGGRLQQPDWVGSLQQLPAVANGWGGGGGGIGALLSWERDLPLSRSGH